VEDATGSITISTGQLFAGKTIESFRGNPEDLRRALMQFDVAGAVPAGATILDATLRLTVTKEIAGNVDMSVHRVTSDWGEGTSPGTGSGGGVGTPATPGDATWIHTFFSGSFWGSAGGDFVGTPSDTATVGAVGTYSWSVLSDVQDMLDSPAGNFGWILVGDEVTIPSAKRIGSRENANAAQRPKLEIEYTTLSPLEFCQGPHGVNTLEVNGDNGLGSGNTVTVDSTGPIEFHIDPAPAGGNGKFVASMNVGAPNASTLDSLPAQLGVSCFTYLLNRGANPAAQWNRIGKVDKIGISQYFGTPIPDPDRAPFTFYSAPGGDAANLPPGSEFTLQAVIINPASPSARGVSLTNAILVSVQ